MKEIRGGKPFHAALSHGVVEEVFPIRILFVDESNLPGSIPGFQALLSRDRQRHRRVRLYID
jgi:hypothetical protein